MGAFKSEQDGYILAPYMDYLSFFFNKDWRLPMKNIVSVMIKLADATILPESMGFPPILTIMALAKKIARNVLCCEGH